MEFLRVVKNSNDLAKVINIPKELINRKVEVIILPYDDKEELVNDKKKSIRGALSKYKNVELQSQESEAWSRAVVEKYENS